MPTTAEFQELYAQLNPHQREAVDAIEGPVMVIAGPGTGKTKILTLRIANILTKTDTPPEAILALTFTSSGATEMRGRLAHIIGVDAYRVTVTTFHSFCNDIIQQYPEVFGDIAGAAPVTDTDQAVLLEELIETADGLELLRPPGAPMLYLHAIGRAIASLKKEGIPPTRLADIANREESAVMDSDDLYHEKGAHKGKMKGAYTDTLKQIAKLRELAALYETYQATLRERKLYDYDDMIMEVARVLAADEHFRLMLQERYQYILVDEHQDTNNAQNRVIELLASFWERPNLFVVGDAKQAIYRFQGASLENFLYFRDLYKDVQLIELQDNYRSSQSILDAAHGIRPSAGKGLRAGTSHTDEPITVLAMSDEDAERYAVAKHLTDRLAQGTRPEDIAVIYRDNADGQSLAGLLEKLNIPHSVSGDNDVFSDPLILQLLAILEAVRDYGQPGPLLNALAMPVLRVTPLDLYKLTDFCRQGRNPYDVIVSPVLCRQAGIDGLARLTDVAALLTRWQGDVRTETTATAFEIIVRDSGVLEAALSSLHAADTLAKLHALYDMIRSLVQRHRAYTLLDLVDHVRFIRAHGFAIKAGSGTPVPGKIRLMTAHKSKGLEFDHVYLIGATDGHWGPRARRELIKLPQAVFLKSAPAAAQEAGDDGDERNVFYVALTRARKTVTITYAQQDIAGGGLLPVRFLTDIKQELLHYGDTADFEQGWTAHRDIHFVAPPPKTADIADREFLNDAFRRQGLSVTALNNYLACPWRYFYSNLVRIPQAPSFALMYGNAVDRALQEYFEKYKEGTDGGKDALLAAFHGFLRHQPMQEQELAAAMTRGDRALSGWWTTYKAQFQPNVINQLKVAAVSLPLTGTDELILNGKMDRVDLLDTHRVVVVDYKTGKPKSRNELLGNTKDADGNYMRQLVFYNLLLDKYLEGRYAMTKGVIDFIDPDTKGNYKKEEFVITAEQKMELEETIRRVAGEILNLSFWDRTCDDRDCEYCKLRKLVA